MPVNQAAFESMHIKVKGEKLQMEKTYPTLSLSRCRGDEALSGICSTEARQGESCAWGRCGVGGDCLNFLQLFHPAHLFAFHSLGFLFGKENCCWLYVQ